MSGRVACVVPALEAAPTLPSVLSALRTLQPRSQVIVVDDGSRDDTSVVAGRWADEVVRHDRNRGKGAALRTGCELARRRGCDLVVTIDADGQHAVSSVPELIGALARADMAVGVRSFTGTSMPHHRRVSNRLSNLAVRALSGRTVGDSQSGFRAVRTSILEAVQPRGDRYEYEIEFLVMALRAGFHVVGVPVPTIYPGPAPGDRGVRSHFRNVRDTAIMCRTMVRLAFAAA